MNRGYSPERREDDMFGTDYDRADRKRDMFNPADRALAFKQAGEIGKAQRMLDELDRACRMLDVPLMRGQSGVERAGELSANAMLQVRWAAKLAKPPSHECFAELFRLIRERA